MDKKYADNPIVHEAPATFLESVVPGAARTLPGGGGPVQESSCGRVAGLR